MFALLKLVAGDHTNPVAPRAVKLVEVPEQTVFKLAVAVTVGAGLTVTVTGEEVEEHPFKSVIVTA